MTVRLLVSPNEPLAVSIVRSGMMWCARAGEPPGVLPVLWATRSVGHEESRQECCQECGPRGVLPGVWAARSVARSVGRQECCQ